MTLTPEQLAALKEVASQAHRSDALASTRTLFRVKFDPGKCLELLEEVERLTNQWNTRFSTLCGNCGKRYLGPRDEGQHGLGICGGTK